MLQILFISIFICMSIKSSPAISIDCNFNSMIAFAIYEPGYQCQVTNHFYMPTPESAVVETVTGKHAEGKTNDDVTVFEAPMTRLNYFPKGLEKFFKNIKYIRLANNQIKEIGQFDLKPFPKLKHIQIQANKIEIIEDDLFKYNPDMEVVWLSSNKIFHVGENTFKNLKNLTHVGFLYNSCNSTKAENKTEVEEIIVFFEEYCKEFYFDRLEKQLKSLEKDLESLDTKKFSTWKRHLTSFEKKFNYSVFSYFTSIKLRTQLLKEIKIEDLSADPSKNVK